MNNKKLLIRHASAVRFLKDDMNSPLSSDGIRKALNFGSKISCPLGFIATSQYKRCKQTVEYIMKTCKSSQPYIINRDVLGDGFRQDNNLCQQTIEQVGSLKKCVAMSLVEKIPGFRSPKMTKDLFLDYMFSHGNLTDSIDIFCSHDIPMAMIVALLFGYKNVDQIKQIWPNNLDFLMFEGTRNNFICSYKGRSININNIISL